MSTGAEITEREYAYFVDPRDTKGYSIVIVWIWEYGIYD